MPKKSKNPKKLHLRPKSDPVVVAQNDIYKLELSDGTPAWCLESFPGFVTIDGSTYDFHTHLHDAPKVFHSFATLKSFEGGGGVVENLDGDLCPCCTPGADNSIIAVLNKFFDSFEKMYAKCMVCDRHVVVGMDREADHLGMNEVIVRCAGCISVPVLA